jgi:antitoxin component YwqK of YwqJK toxin-antitoxin module
MKILCYERSRAFSNYAKILIFTSVFLPFVSAQAQDLTWTGKAKVQLCWEFNFCVGRSVRGDQLREVEGLFFEESADAPYSGQSLFYKQGRLDKRYFVNDGKSFAVIKYDRYSNRFARGYLVEGIAHGEWLYLWGNATESGSFNYGVPIGNWKYLYDNGPTKILTWEHNSFLNVPVYEFNSGSFNGFREDGTLDQTAKLKNGFPDGKQTFFDETGQAIVAEISFKEGLRDGVSKFFDEEGVLTNYSEYFDGALHGRTFGVLEDGSKYEQTWHQGARHGIQKNFWPSGELKEKAEFYRGRLISKVEEFDEEGNKSGERNWTKLN